MAKGIYFSYQALIALQFFIKGQEGFFIKHVVTKLCLEPGDNAYASKSGLSSYFLEFTNNCYDPKAQFRFVNDEYIENIQLNAIIQTSRDRLIVVGPITKLTKDELRKSFLELKQTKNGSLRLEACEKKVCATPATSGRPSVGHFLNVTKSCDKELQRFVFGSITCEMHTIKDVNCNNKSQGIVIQYAWYGLLRTMDIGTGHARPCTSRFGGCGGYRTSLFKTRCDKKSSCSLYVNQPGGDSCSGMTKALYLEYNCAEKQQTMEMNPVIAVDVKLVSSVLPNEGLLQIGMDNITNHVCNNSLSDQGREVICRQLGYQKVKQAEFLAPTLNYRAGKFSGKIYCNGEEKELSECCFDNATQVEDCSRLDYILCLICTEPLLEDQSKFPDELFKSPNSLPNHGAAKARISSNSSWCAPSDGDHFLDIDLGRAYVINGVATFGDSAMAWWVTSYILNYTLDGENWMELLNQNKTEIDGNTGAFNNVAMLKVNSVQARVLRFMPTKSIGQPCMRVEICGHTLYPDAVKSLAVTKRTSTSVTISWDPPLNTGDQVLSHFYIKLMKMRALVRNFTITDVQTMQYNVAGLSPYTEYVLTVVAGNVYGFGEERTVSFATAEAAPSGPPRDITIVAQSSSSLSVAWKKPDEDKRNGIITQYTVCISHDKDETCFREYATKDTNLLILNLDASTEYFIRIRARTSAGDGIFSRSLVQYTNEEQIAKFLNASAHTLSFVLQTAKENVRYFKVIAFKLVKDQVPKNSTDTFDDAGIGTYAGAQRSLLPKLYIAAAYGMENARREFILGDDRSFFVVRTQHQSTNEYFNGPLESDSSYSVFQRFYVDENNYYSTDWSQPFRTKAKHQGTISGIKSCQCSSKTLLFVVVSILVIITAVQSLGIIYMCVNRQKDNNSKNDRIVACVDNKTFSEGNYEEVQVACSSNSNIEKSNSNPYEELHQYEHEQDHTYQSLQKKIG